MKTYTLSHDEIATLCLELALFLHAGADSGSGLALLAEETDHPRLKELLGSMARGADEGQPLSAVFKASGAFPRQMWTTLRVGEATGRTEEALRALARYHERRDQMDRQLRAALLYPSILLLIMLAVIVVLLAKVLPIFNDVYASLGGQLTGLAGGLLRLGGWLDKLLPLLCAVFLLVGLGLCLFSASGRFRARVLALWQRSRGDRGVNRKLAGARFAQALSMGLSSGLTPEQAVESAGQLLDGPTAQRAGRCLELLAQGSSLPRALRETELMPAAECRLLELGFASGSGEAAAAEIARRLDRDAEEALERRLAQVEPVMVVATSLLVGLILLAVMLPLSRILASIG